MGEVFKGLTIKIGADTTNVQLHIKNLNNTLKSTQKNLRTIEAALKFDPSSVSLLATKFGLTREQLVLVTAQISQFKRRMQEIENSVGLDKIRAQIGNITTTLANAKTNVVKYDAELENLYRDLEKVAAEHGLAFEKGKTDIPALISKLESYGENLTELKTKWEQLRAAQKLATEERDTAKLISEYKNLGVQVEYSTAKIKNMATSLSASSTYVGKLTTEMRQGASAIKTMDAYIESLNSRIKVTQSAYSAANTELKAMQSRMSNVSKNSKEAFNNAYIKTYEQTVSALEQKITQLQSKYDALRTAAAQFSTETTSFTKLATASETVKNKLTDVETEIANITSKLLDAKQRLETFVAAGDTMSADYKQVRQEVSELAVKLESAETQASKLRATASQIRAGFEMSSVSAEIHEAESALASLNTTARVTNGTLRNLGITMTATLSAAAYMFFFKAAEAANELDSAFRNMKKTVNATEQEYENLYQAAVKYGETHITSAAEILEIEALGGQLGIAADQLEDFSKTVSNLDIAIESVDSDELAESLGKLSNQFQWADGDMEKFGDSLTRLGNNMPTTEDKIISVTGRLSSMASIVGMTTQETLAWSTALAATTQGAESAATGLSKTISKIETAVATGGDSLTTFASIAGMSAQEFADAWGTSPSDALRAFIQGLKDLDSQGVSVDATLQSLGITSVRQKESIQNLVQTVDTLDDALLMSADAWDGISDQWGDAGDAANEAAKKAEGFSGALATLENAASVLGASIMDSVTPVLQAAGTVLAAINNVITPMPGVVKEMIVAFAGMAVITGPLLNLYAGIKNVTGAAKQSVQQTTMLQKAVNNLSQKLVTSTTQTTALATATKAETTATKAAASAATRKATAETKAATATKTAATATEASTTAEKLNTTAKETNTVATEANATALKTTTTATKAATAATEASTVASKLSAVASAALSSSFVAAAASSQLLNKALMTIAPVAALTAAVAAINLLSSAITKAAQATEEKLGVSFKDLNEQLKTTKSNVADVEAELNKIATNADQIRSLASQYIELAESTGETAATSAELYAIQAQLAACSSDLSEALFDGEEATSMSADAMRALCEEQAAAIEQEAAMNALTNLYSERATLAQNLEDAETALAKAEGDQATRAGTSYVAMKRMQNTVANYKTELESLDADIEEYSQRLSEQARAQNILDTAISQVTQGTLDLSGAYEYINTTLEQAGLSTDEYGISLEELEQKVDTTAAVMEEELVSALETLETEIDEAISSDALLGQAFEQAGIDTSRLAELLNATGQSVDDFTSKVYDDVSDICFSWDTLSQNTENNVAKLNSSMVSNTESITGWYNDLTTILQYANETGNESLAQLATSLEAGGYEAGSVAVAEIANGIRSGDTSAATETAQNYSDALTATMEAEAAYLEASGAGLIEDLNTGVNTAATTTDFTTTGTGIATGLCDFVTTALNEALPTVGSAVSQGLANGITESLPLINPAAQSLATTAIDTTSSALGVQSPSTVFMEIGSNVVAGFVQGISDNSASIEGAAQSLANTLVEAFNTTDTSGIGAQLAQNLASNITSQAGAVSSAGQTLGNSFVSGLTSSQSLANTSGVSAGTGYVTGITSKNSASSSAGKTLATQAINGVKGVTSQFTTQGSSAGSKYASGVSNKKSSALSAGKSLATSAKSGAGSVSAYSTGANFGIGYGNGISSTSSYVYSRAYSLARQAVAAANDAQNSGSPSKEAAKIGKWFGEGYGQGIESTADFVDDATSALIQTALDASELGATFISNYATGIISQYARLQKAAEGAAEIVQEAFSNNAWQGYSNYATYAMYEPNMNAANTATAVNVNLDGYLTKEDVYSAFVSALKTQQTEVTLNIDGRAFANAIATSQDSVNGKRQSLVARGVAL